MSDTYNYYEERGEKPKSKIRIVSWIERKVKGAIDFYEEHRELCNIVALTQTALISLVTIIVKNTTKSASLRKEEDLKNLYVYDRKFGHYWKLRKPLSNTEWLRINEAVARGETMGDVLERMNVLSKK